MDDPCVECECRPVYRGDLCYECMREYQRELQHERDRDDR